MRRRLTIIAISAFVVVALANGTRVPQDALPWS
jgi:hypothetical protein